MNNFTENNNIPDSIKVPGLVFEIDSDSTLSVNFPRKYMDESSISLQDLLFRWCFRLCI